MSIPSLTKMRAASQGVPRPRRIRMKHGSGRSTVRVGWLRSIGVSHDPLLFVQFRRSIGFDAANAMPTFGPDLGFIHQTDITRIGTKKRTIGTDLDQDKITPDQIDHAGAACHHVAHEHADT
jgi:hypothetical protein